MSDFTKRERFVALVSTAASVRASGEFLDFIEENRAPNGRARNLSKARDYATLAADIVYRATYSIKEEHLAFLDDADFFPEQWTQAAQEFIDMILARGAPEYSRPPWLEKIGATTSKAGPMPTPADEDEEDKGSAN